MNSPKLIEREVNPRTAWALEQAGVAPLLARLLAARGVREASELDDNLAQLLPPGRPAIVVGHSLGGPLAAWMAIDHPERVCAAVMVAGSVASSLEAPRWYNHLADTALARWLAPPEMLWSNREMFALAPELKRLEAAWPALARPLVAIQGEHDELVDPRTVDQLERQAPAAMVRIVRAAGEGHFVLWQRPDIVLREIAALPCPH